MSEKKKRRRHSEEFKREAVARMRESKNITGLTRELGIRREDAVPVEVESRRGGRGGSRYRSSRRRRREDGSLETLRRENGHLKRVLAEKALEVDFFKGALQQVEARRRSRAGSGETPSTRASVRGRSQGKAD